MRHAFHKMPWTKPVLLALATLAFGVAPALTPPFTGYDPGLFPVRIDRPSIQPAGYAFAIWGLIYLWLGAHALFGLIWRRTDPAWDAVRTPLTIAIVLGAVWLAIANEAPLMATIAIWIMQVTALAAFLRADPNGAEVYTRKLPPQSSNSITDHEQSFVDDEMLVRVAEAAKRPNPVRMIENLWRSTFLAYEYSNSNLINRWLLSAPTAILAGWLTAAAAVSLGVVLAGYGILGDTVAALVMLALVLGIAVVAQARQPAMPVYGATVLWALGGVIAVNWTPNPTVAWAALAGALILGANLARTAFRR